MDSLWSNSFWNDDTVCRKMVRRKEIRFKNKNVVDLFRELMLYLYPQSL